MRRGRPAPHASWPPGTARPSSSPDWDLAPDRVADHGGRRRSPGRRDAPGRPPRGHGGLDARATRRTGPSMPCPSCAGRRRASARRWTCPRSSGPLGDGHPTFDRADPSGPQVDADRGAGGGRAMRPLPELTPATEWFWTSGADGRLRIQRCTECSVARPSTRAHLPRVPEPGVGAHGRLRPGHGHRLHGQPAPVASRLRAALRRRRGGPGRGPLGAADHHASWAATRPRSPSARRWRSGSSTTTTCGSRCSSPPGETAAGDPVAEPGPRPRAPARATTGSSTAPCCPASGGRRSAAG